MMWEACAEKVKKMGGTIEMGSKVVGCHYDAEAGLWTVTYEDADKRRYGDAGPARHLVGADAPAWPTASRRPCPTAPARRPTR